MTLSNKHIQRFGVYYLVCFTLYYLWLFNTGVLISRLQPVFFITKLDITRNFLMLTNLQHLLINSHSAGIIFDCLFLFFPYLLVFCRIKNYKITTVVGIITVIYSLVYCIFLSAFTYLCMEGLVCWFFLPLVLANNNATAFYYQLHTVRIIFLIIFFSAGLWKIRGTGIFYPQEMSGVLVLQHGSYLACNSDNFFSRMVLFLIRHPYISYSLYLAATLLELAFVIGFFTRKYDRILMICFILFIGCDYFLMQINYSMWLVFLGCFYYSTLESPENKQLS